MCSFFCNNVDLQKVALKQKGIMPFELSRLRRNFFDKIDRINPPASPERERWRAGKIFLYSLYPEHPVYPV